MKEKTSRQERLLSELKSSDGPLTGTELALRCHVTRQVVVHDIALLRARGIKIHSTPRGYTLGYVEDGMQKHVVSVCHPPEMTEVELKTFVQHGVRILDVLIEHPLYGELKGSLELRDERDVALFVEQVKSQDAVLLSSLTDGHHLHTVECQSEEQLELALNKLRQLGIQVLD